MDAEFDCTILIVEIWFGSLCLDSIVSSLLERLFGFVLEGYVYNTV